MIIVQEPFIWPGIKKTDFKLPKVFAIFLLRKLVDIEKITHHIFGHRFHLHPRLIVSVCNLYIVLNSYIDYQTLLAVQIFSV